jgi:hypothetical protein
MLKRILFFLFFLFIINYPGFCQENGKQETKILFRGLVIDAKTSLPVANSQIMINRAFSAVSNIDGSFSFYLSRNDTALFKSLGYKPTILFVSDTLSGLEFNAGIYLNSDTLSIGEVVIVPRYNNLRSEILNAKSKTPSTMENARYNVAVSAYQGRTSQNKLGDPAANYEFLRQRQKIDAFEKGGIPSDKMIGISPLLIVPAAYLLIHGLPEKPDAMKPELTSQEVDQIKKKYQEMLKQRK